MQEPLSPAPRAVKKKRGCLSWIIGIGVLGVLGLLGYAASGPYRTLSTLQNALAQSDPNLLAKCVDFPTLRQNLKTQLLARANDGINAMASSGLLSQIAGGIAGGVIDATVDGLVTPSGLSRLFAGASLAGNQFPSVAGEPPKSRLENAQGSFESASTFIVTVPSSSSNIIIELSRNGLDWQVTNVRLPASSQ